MIRMKTYRIIILIFLGVCLCLAEDIRNCTVKEHLPCKLYMNVPATLEMLLPPALSYKLTTSWSQLNFEKQIQCRPTSLEWVSKICTIGLLQRTYCSPPALHDRFPDLYLNHSWRPSGSSWLEPNITDALYMNYGPFPKGVFTFRPPHDGSISFLKGFEIQVYRPDRTEPKCHIYDLSNATWKEGTEDFEVQGQHPLHWAPFQIAGLQHAWEWEISHQISTYFYHETVFSLILHPMEPNKEYFLYLYSLPKQPAEYEQISGLRVNTFGASSPEQSPLKWRASISYSVNTPKQEVFVSFLQPEKKYGFTEFEVTLKNLSTGARQVVYTSQYNHTFTDVENGVYEIWLMPIQSKSCWCMESEFVCKHCYTTRTLKNFTMNYVAPATSAPSTSPTAPKPSGHTSAEFPKSESSTRAGDRVTEVQVALAVVGSLLGIGLVVGMLVLYYFCRRKSEGDENDNEKPEITEDMDSVVTIEALKKGGVLANNNKAEKVKLEHRPKLFVLYEEDHQYHRKVVDYFTTYLQNYCHCDVMCAQLQLDTTWVHQEIQQADYVVIVNSKVAHSIYRSLLIKNRGQTEHSPSGSVKSPGINCILQRFLQEPHYDKTVMVYFDYTSEDHIIPDICPGYNYKLMKHFTDFLLHVHQLKRTDKLSHYELPLDGQYDLKPVGKELKTAIRMATDYEREHPHWFSQNFAYLRSFSNTSEESGFDSGLPQEPGFLDPITEQLHGYIDATSQDAITIPPPTANHRELYLALSPNNFHPHIYDKCNPGSMSPEAPTTADSGQFDFIPPDDLSEFDTTSKTQSEQMMSINARNCGYDNKAYDWKQDLVLLRVQSGEIPFSDVHSLGGESV